MSAMKIVRSNTFKSDAEGRNTHISVYVEAVGTLGELVDLLREQGVDYPHSVELRGSFGLSWVRPSTQEERDRWSSAVRATEERRVAWEMREHARLLAKYGTEPLVKL